jgi:transposase
MSYDKKVREQALKYKATHTQCETSEVFGVSVSAIKRWQKLQKETGSVEKKELTRSWRRIDPELLKADVEKYPEDFNWERAVRFGCHEEGIRKAMKRNKLTRKKRV